MQCPFTPDGDLSVVSPDSCVHIPQKMKDFAQVSKGWSACMINPVGTVHNESKRTSHDDLHTSEHLGLLPLLQSSSRPPMANYPPAFNTALTCWSLAKDLRLYWAQHSKVP